MSILLSAFVSVVVGLILLTVFELVGFNGWNAGYWVATVQQIVYWILRML